MTNETLEKYAKLLKNPTAKALAQLPTDEYRQLLKIASPEAAHTLREIRTHTSNDEWRERNREGEKARHRAYYAERMADISDAEREAVRAKNREAKRKQRAAR